MVILVISDHLAGLYDKHKGALLSFIDTNNKYLARCLTEICNISVMDHS